SELQHWSGASHDFVRQAYISTFDGQDSKMYYPKGAEHYNRGIMLPYRTNINVRGQDTLAIIMTYRPLHARMSSFKKENYRIAKGAAMLGGRTLLVLEEVKPQYPGLKQSWWVDAGRECSVVRFTLQVGDTTTLQTTIDYKED